MPAGAQKGGVTEDATLDAFGDDGSTATGSESEGTTGSDAEPGGDAPAPLPLTSSWRPDGDCAACGEHVSRRWWDGSEHVCGDCVSWSASAGDACDQ